MRKIDENASANFTQHQNWKSGNTQTKVGPNKTGLFLHGHEIAHISRDNEILVIQTCGWNTATTKARLNALPGVEIKSKGGQWYLNGEKWDGKSTRVR